MPTFVYKTTPQSSLRLDRMAAEPGPGLAPAVLWIHGGALIFGSRQWWRPWQVERYRRAGYAFLAMDYRLAPETKLPAIREDLQDAWQWIQKYGRDQLKIDPRRVAVVGHSAGGYLTLLAGACLKPASAALVSFYGYGDIIGPWYSQPDSFYRSTEKPVSEAAARACVGEKELVEGLDDRFPFYLYCRQQGRWPCEVAGRDPRQEPGFFAAFCPVQNVTRHYPPTILLHGDKDTDVPCAQSKMMAAALKKAGVEHELCIIPGGEHSFDQDQNHPSVQEAFRRVLAFLHQHL